MHSHPHEHEHEHALEHPHPHEAGPVEAHNASAGLGPVLVDVGDGAGALVLLADPEQVGLEIEISPVGEDDRRSHVAVLSRPYAGRRACAAVYPSLAAGPWQLWDPASGEPALTVLIEDGEITLARWPGQAA